MHWLELSRLREWKPLKTVFRRFNVSLRTRLRCRWYFLSALEPKNRMALDIDAFVIVCLSWKLTAVISMITFYLMVKHLRRCSSGEIAELSSQLINQLSFNNKRLQSHRGHKSFNYKSSTKSSSWNATACEWFENLCLLELALKRKKISFGVVHMWWHGWQSKIKDKINRIRLEIHLLSLWLKNTRIWLHPIEFNKNFDEASWISEKIS